MDRILSCPSREPYYKQRAKGAFTDIFFLTTLDRAQEFISVMKHEAEEHTYSASEIGVYLQPIQQGRAIHLEFTLYYNPIDEKEVEKARSLFTSASSALSKAGAFYSRPYGIWADLAYSKCPDTVSVLRKVKDMLDPDHVLNQGKLCFNKEVI
jgi:hypothetical protein